MLDQKTAYVAGGLRKPETVLIPRDDVEKALQ